MIQSRRMVLAALVYLLVLAGCSQAGNVDTSLAQARKDGRAVMLELGSVGCIACDQMKPVMERLSNTYKGKLDVIFVDVKKDHGTAQKFGVYMIPVQVFLDKGGREFHRHVGFYSYEEIEMMLNKSGI